MMKLFTLFLLAAATSASGHGGLDDPIQNVDQAVLSSQEGAYRDHDKPVPTTIGAHGSSSGSTFVELLQQQQKKQDRTLQEARYRNNYVGRFQYLLDGGCSGSKPVLQAFCKGTITLLDTSHPTIECSPLEDGTEAGYNGYECINTCADAAACSNIYVEGGSLDGGVFGEVYFQCDGVSVEDVEGFFVWEASTGSCDGSQFLDGRNFHVLQLAVYCEEGKTFWGGDGYFECINGGSLRTDGIFQYTCVTGRNCDSSSCNVEFSRIMVEPDLHIHACIQSLDGSEVPAVPAPAVDPRPAGTYSAEFRANWELTVDNFWCGFSFPTISIACINGIVSEIETVVSTTNCVAVSENAIECTEPDRSAYENRYSGVMYTCTAVDEIPMTEVVYEEGTVTCSTDGTFLRSIHKVQLGPFCGSQVSGGDYSYIDPYVECQTGNNFFTSDDDIWRYTCNELAPIPPREGIAETIDTVRMYTDFRWANGAAIDCYTYEASQGIMPPPTEMPVAPPIASPVSALTASPITREPTSQEPMGEIPTSPPPTELPVAAPMASPVLALTVSPITRAPTSQEPMGENTTSSPPTELPVAAPMAIPVSVPTASPAFTGQEPMGETPTSAPTDSTEMTSPTSGGASPAAAPTATPTTRTSSARGGLFCWVTNTSLLAFLLICGGCV